MRETVVEKAQLLGQSSLAAKYNSECAFVMKTGFAYQGNLIA